MLSGLIRDYEQTGVTAGQQQAAVNRFCVEVYTIDGSEWTPTINAFRSAHCR